MRQVSLKQGLLFFAAVFLISAGATFMFNAKIDKVVKAARSYTGVRYQIGGMNRKGIDCSALMLRAFASVGYTLPRVSRMQATIGKKIPLDKLQIGDLVFFGHVNSTRVTHVGMVTVINSKKDVKFINATCSKGVMESNLFGNYWGARLLHARRIPIGKEVKKDKIDDDNTISKDVIIADNTTNNNTVSSDVVYDSNNTTSNSSNSKIDNDVKNKNKVQINKPNLNIGKGKNKGKKDIKKKVKVKEDKKKKNPNFNITSNKNKGKKEVKIKVKKEEVIIKSDDKVKVISSDNNKTVKNNNNKNVTATDDSTTNNNNENTIVVKKGGSNSIFNKVTFDPVFFGASNIVKKAKKYMGVPYKKGGMTKNGIDNIGLLAVAFAEVDAFLPDNLDDLKTAGVPADVDYVETGDILLFVANPGETKIVHAGMVSKIVGNSLKGYTVSFIHASKTGGVKETHLNIKVWKDRVYKVRRLY